MKRILLLSAALAYIFFMFICFAANAMPKSSSGPWVHIHSIKDFRGKTTVKDTIFQVDTARIHHLKGMRKRFRHAGQDSAMMAHRKTMMESMHENSKTGWAGRSLRKFMNADSIAVYIKTTVHGDSMIRDIKRIAYFEPSASGKTSDTLVRMNITVHHGLSPRDIPDFPGQNFLNESGTNGNTETGTDGGTLMLNNLNIYPNPSGGLYSIHFNTEDKSLLSLKITDMNGKTVWQNPEGTAGGNYYGNIDLTAQPKGIYILEITQNNKSVLKKLVKD